METTHIKDCLRAANGSCLNKPSREIDGNDSQPEDFGQGNEVQACDLSMCHQDLFASDKVGSKEEQINPPEDITPEDAASVIEANCLKDDLVILDVSTKWEYSKWHVENAINMNFFSMKFRKNIEKLDKVKTYLVYCKMGGRSKMAQKMMKHIGFKKVYNIAGGRDRWQAEGLPFGSKVQGTTKTSFLSIMLPMAFSAIDLTNSCLTWLQEYPLA